MENTVQDGYSYTETEDDYGLLADGEYELSIDKMETKTLESGSKKVALQFRVRSDVDQAHQNRVVFEDIWKERETIYYNRKRINQLIGTQKLEDGQKFSNIDEIIALMNGANVREKIVVKYDDYHEKDVNSISYYMSSKEGAQELGAKKETTNEKGVPTIDVAEDDLPF